MLTEGTFYLKPLIYEVWVYCALFKLDNQNPESISRTIDLGVVFTYYHFAVVALRTARSNFRPQDDEIPTALPSLSEKPILVHRLVNITVI